MRKKYLFLILVVAVLVALNLWKWIPTLVHRGNNSTHRGTAPGLALEFPEAQGGSGKAIRRDLFALGSAGGARSSSKKSVKPPAPSLTPAVSAPIPTAVPAPVAGGYRLMGVVSREGKNQALLGKGEETILVAPGDVLEGRYRVESLTENEVYLTDQPTGNTLKLRIGEPQGEK